MFRKVSRYQYLFTKQPVAASRRFGTPSPQGWPNPWRAVLGFFLFSQFINEYFFGVVFFGVAGIMVYVSLDELLPTAKKNDHHLPIIGVFCGMAIVALSLVFFIL
jgi:ZIP family zinc transporter